MASVAIDTGIIVRSLAKRSAGRKRPRRALIGGAMSSARSPPKSAIIASPLINFEVSQSGFGMYVKYLMAGFLGVFAVTMMVQFVSYLFEAVAD